jgi:calcineurin-like phosphoesterase family protein
MATWYTADTHFGHENIISFCSRPFNNVHEMNRILTDNWNSRVKDGDLVIHVGDFGSPRCKDPRPYLKHLNGTIILVKGNHDKAKMLKHMPFWVYNMETRIGDFNCLLNHRPIYPKSMRGKNDRFNDHDDKVQNPEKYHFIISGHVHEKKIWTDRSFNVGVDKHEFAPICEEELYYYLEERAKEFNNKRKQVRVCI